MPSKKSNQERDRVVGDRQQHNLENMISGSASCYPNSSQGLSMYEDNIVSSNPLVAGSGPEAHSSSLLYNLSILKDKVHQVQSLVSILISPDHQTGNPESTSLAISSMGSLVQEIIVTASSMIFICQQMSLGTTSSAAGNNSNIDHHQLHQQHVRVPENNGISQQQLQQQQQQQNFDSCLGNSILQERGQGFFPSSETIACWYGNNNNDDSANSRALQVSKNGDKLESRKELPRRSEITEGSQGVSVSVSPNNYDIIELDAADLLAKYTHYCQICGKGFKRDANLRMHMRAHGDEYKTTAALTNPMKNHHDGSSEGMGPNCSTKLPKKYSCPQEGCRWNKKHAKFQPLKSMICVKNHYKRSHCPKMYVCKRCNRKQFSVLSDLRTHEKHCGDLKWQCSCGTTFSRKDKLMGHVALFVGHSPVITSLTKPAKLEPQATTIQQDDRV